jgi:hypothetical protein
MASAYPSLCNCDSLRPHFLLLPARPAAVGNPLQNPSPSRGGWQGGQWPPRERRTRWWASATRPPGSPLGGLGARTAALPPLDLRSCWRPRQVNGCKTAVHTHQISREHGPHTPRGASSRARQQEGRRRQVAVAAWQLGARLRSQPAVGVLGQDSAVFSLHFTARWIPTRRRASMLLGNVWSHSSQTHCQTAGRLRAAAVVRPGRAQGPAL